MWDPAQRLVLLPAAPRLPDGDPGAALVPGVDVLALATYLENCGIAREGIPRL